MFNIDKAYKILDTLKPLIYLSHFNINIGKKDEDDGYEGTLKTCDYSHFSGKIILNFEKINEKLKKGLSGYDNLVKLMLHELCHIYTSSGSFYIDDIEKQLDYSIGSREKIFIRNNMSVISEQMTVILERIFWKKIYETKEIKNLLSELKKDNGKKEKTTKK